LEKAQLFKERSSEQLKMRDNYMKTNIKNIRSANDSPVTSQSPLFYENKGGMALPFLPALNKNEVRNHKITMKK